MKEQTVRSLAELKQFAEAILKECVPNGHAAVLALSGNLGAGKTAFAQVLGEILGVEEHIVSPTFVLMRAYETKHPQWRNFVHIDAYRFEEEREAAVLRLPELFREPHTLVCIEWPLRIAAAIPSDALRLEFTREADESRRIQYGR